MWYCVTDDNLSPTYTPWVIGTNTPGESRTLLRLDLSPVCGATPVCTTERSQRVSIVQAARTCLAAKRARCN